MSTEQGNYIHPTTVTYNNVNMQEAISYNNYLQHTRRNKKRIQTMNGNCREWNEHHL